MAAKARIVSTAWPKHEEPKVSATSLRDRASDNACHEGKRCPRYLGRCAAERHCNGDRHLMADPTRAMPRLVGMHMVARHTTNMTLPHNALI